MNTLSYTNNEYLNSEHAGSESKSLTQPMEPMDRLLSSFFQSEMPKTWPTAQSIISRDWTNLHSRSLFTQNDIQASSGTSVSTLGDLTTQRDLTANLQHLPVNRPKQSHGLSSRFALAGSFAILLSACWIIQEYSSSEKNNPEISVKMQQSTANSNILKKWIEPARLPNRSSPKK